MWDCRERERERESFFKRANIVLVVRRRTKCVSWWMDIIFILDIDYEKNIKINSKNEVFAYYLSNFLMLEVRVNYN
jgi:hypothetical protein